MPEPCRGDGRRTAEPKTRKEDLRLDTPEGACAKLKDSDLHAIVSGKPNESAILTHWRINLKPNRPDSPFRKAGD